MLLIDFGIHVMRDVCVCVCARARARVLHTNKFALNAVQKINRRRSLSLKNEMFFEGDMRPDMYGPFWLCTTLVCASIW